MVKNKKIVVAIDGFSSSGKSTFAKLIAKELNLLYIDSGAMYRAVTLFCIRNNIITNKKIDLKRLKNELNNINIDFQIDTVSDKYKTYLNKENIEEEIRNNPHVANNVSLISAIKEVREKLVDCQREYAKNRGVVMDGRDIGTVVFPNADIKIFLVASVKIRADRRYKELIEKGLKVDYKEIFENIKSRDYIDSNREISPLRKADDAIELDNGNMTIEEQMEWFWKRFKVKLP